MGSIFDEREKPTKSKTAIMLERQYGDSFEFEGTTIVKYLGNEESNI